MKIVMPMEEKSLKGSVCDSFGRAPYFLIYDTETKNENFFESVASRTQGGAGVMTAQIITDKKVDAVITPRCGEKAANVLKAAKIEIFKSNSPIAQENIESFQENKLNKLDEVHKGFHHHGGR
ncbi:NifB/NifX family molybdenum-iron cluster-binding protein [Proteinivorax hydrogeniformans]|uniref:NifB/NifX family molybdenum-iron cluster-binding protein n=1 Tax=Proteinivorax hydrogeniformans TaxID=1826727 RepID=A0AAU8HUN9_9FIRM